MTTETEVRTAAGRLPGAYEQPTYDDAPSFRTQPRMFAWIRADAEVGTEPALVLWVATVEEKEALISADPDGYFTVPHYDGVPIVLARLAAISTAEMTEMLTESYRLRAPRRLVAQLNG